jgi:hypothetical protein
MPLHVLIKSEDGHDCDNSDEDFENDDPDVCVVDAVGSVAVSTACHGGDCYDPEDD